MKLNEKVIRAMEDISFRNSFPEDFVPSRMSYEELLSRLTIAYDAIEELLYSSLED